MIAQSSWHLNNTYESYFEFIGIFNKFIERVVSNLHAIHALNLAVEELITNIIKFNADGEVTVKVSIAVLEDIIELDITDSGVAFDPRNSNSVDFSKPLDEIPIGGLGLDLVRKSFDVFDYKRDNQSNILHLVLRGIK